MDLSFGAALLIFGALLTVVGALSGRESIDAVAIFGSLLALATANRDLVREATLIASGRRDARELL